MIRRSKPKAPFAPARARDKARAESPVVEAVRRAGGVRKVCYVCDVGQATVYLWLRSGHVPYLRQALKLSRAARMPVSLLAGPESEWSLKK
jgi:hypothetical protein